MTTHVHFVGSAGFDSTEDFFSAAGDTVKAFLRRCPDGEVGPRRLWTSYQWPVLRAARFLEVDSDNAIPGLGLCALRFRPSSKPELIHFGQLGYAREARTSYQDFIAAREQGVFTRNTRFQVCLPTPFAVIDVFIVPADVQKILPAYEEAMIREVKEICAIIPHADLALQWDVCMEMIRWDGRFPHMASFPNMKETFAGAFARICASIPTGVELGFHFCYGDLDAKHVIEPADLGKAVELANLVIASARRPVNWIHMPVPKNRDDAAYFAPLQRLKLSPETEIYLGLVHAEGGVEGTVRRMKAARAFLNGFGIATECGIGRAPTPDMARDIMRVHAQAANTFS